MSAWRYTAGRRRSPLRARNDRALLAAASLLGLIACQGPPVDVRAVWMDGQGGVLHVYDRGELRSHPSSPKPFGGEADARVHLGPRGRFVLQRDGPSDLRRGRVFDLEQKRSFAIALAQLLPGGQERVSFLAGADALGWVESVCIDASCPDASLYIAPLTTGLRQDAQGEARSSVELVAAGPVDSQSQVLGAADAPVAYVAGPGELAAFRYPNSPGDAYALKPLGRALVPDLPVPAQVQDCPFSSWCGVRMAVEPGGSAIYFASANEACGSGFGRWRPGEDAECIALPATVVDARLLAAIDYDKLVFVDDARLHLVDVSTGDVQALPVLGRGDYFFRQVQRGRALVFASYDGPVLRADDLGLSLVSNATTQCQDADSPVISRDGYWVAWRCGRAPDVSLGEDFAAALVRVGASSLRRYPGVASWPLAIDDDGDLLFMTTAGSSESIPDNQPSLDDEGLSGFSDGFGESGGFDWGDTSADGFDDEGDTDGGVGPGDLIDPFAGGSIDRLTPSPLTLYTLSVGEVIRRVSELEPTPVPLKRMETGVSRYLQAY